MSTFKTILAYLFYASAAAAFFLYMLFPDQAVKTYLDNRLAAIDPSLAVTAETIRPAIPPGLKMSAVDLNRNGVRMALIDQARLTLDLSTLLQEQQRFQFKALLADGTVNGRGSMEGGGPSGRLRTEADLSEIRLERLDGIQSLAHVTLSGALSGRLTHEGAPAATGKIDGLLTVAGLRISLKNAFFGISELIMDQTEADFSVSGETLRLKALTFEGSMLEGKIYGTIQLANPFASSRLNLTGNVKPRPEFFTRLQGSIPQGIVNPRTLGTRGLNFQVYGTADKPDVSMR